MSNNAALAARAKLLAPDVDEGPQLEGYSTTGLAELLIEQLPAGDPVAIASYALMLHNREGGARALAEIATDKFERCAVVALEE